MVFGRLKELYDLKKKADAMKKDLEAIHLEVEERGVRIKIRGDQHFEEIVIDGQRDERLREALNKAVRESQKKVSKKMQGNLGDLKAFGLK